MPANEKRRYVMTSDLRQYITEYTVANFWRYPIRRRVTYASALECLLFVYVNCSVQKHPLCYMQTEFLVAWFWSVIIASHITWTLHHHDINMGFISSIRKVSFCNMLTYQQFTVWWGPLIFCNIHWFYKPVSKLLISLHKCSKVLIRLCRWDKCHYHIFTRKFVHFALVILTWLSSTYHYCRAHTLYSAKISLGLKGHITHVTHITPKGKKTHIATFGALVGLAFDCTVQFYKILSM